MKNVAIISALVASLAAPAFAGDRADAIFAELAAASDGETKVQSTPTQDPVTFSTKNVGNSRAAAIFAELAEASDGNTKVGSSNGGLVSVLSSKGGQSERVAAIFAEIEAAGREDEN